MFIEQLPPLDIHHPPELYTCGTLVRFRAMIQDTSLTPEIYLAHLGDSCCGWGMSPSTQAERDIMSHLTHSHSDLREASVVWAVSIPAESQWYIDETSPSVSSTRTPIIVACVVDTLQRAFLPTFQLGHTSSLSQAYPTSVYKSR